MKALSLATVALVATAGAASAQFEGTFGSNGQFGFDGTTGFSNCFSGGQGEAGVGGTNCSSGSHGTYSFQFGEHISGAYTQGESNETVSQTSHSNGIQNTWQKAMTANGTTKQGISQVGNVWNTQSQTQSQGGFAIDGDIVRNTRIGFEGTGYTNTNSFFSSGMGTTCNMMAGQFTCNMGGNGGNGGNGGAD